MLKTKSIYAPAGQDDGQRILVTRFYPRGVKRERFDEWRRELAPSANLLRQYKDAVISEDEFVRSFIVEMNSSESRRVIAELHDRARSSTITILCYEPDGTLCHRHLLRDVIHDMRKLRLSFKPRYSDHPK